MLVSVKGPNGAIRQVGAVDPAELPTTGGIKSVNGETGPVVKLGADLVPEGTNHLFLTPAERARLNALPTQVSNLEDRVEYLEEHGGGGTGPGGGGETGQPPAPRTIQADSTLTDADVAAGLVNGQSANDITLTVPPNLRRGSIDVTQLGSGRIRFNPATGTTLETTADKLLSTSGLRSAVRLLNTGPGSYLATGALASLTAPIITASSFTVNENLPLGTVVGTVTTTGGAPTEWKFVPASTDFTIDLTGTIRTAKSLDYESVSRYALTVEASNIIGKSVAAVLITVGDVAERPVVRAGQVMQIPASAMIGDDVGLVVASDAPTSYDIVGGTGAAFFAISATGRLTVAQLLDYETQAEVTLQVTASNSIGTSDPVALIVRVVDLDTGLPPGVITNFSLVGTGTPAGTVMPNMGIMFRDGDMTPADDVTVRLASTGAPVRTQIDPKTYYPSGNVRHALLAIECPALADGTETFFEVVKNEDHPVPAIDLNMPGLLASRQASITITPASGPAGTYNLAQLLPTTRWRLGQLYAEARVALDLPAAVTGRIGGELKADISITKDGRLGVSFVVWNRKGLNIDYGDLNYALKLTLDNKEVYSSGAFTHSLYTGFARERTSGPGGTVLPRLPVYRPNVLYAASTGLLPPLDLAMGMGPRFLTEYEGHLDSFGWEKPMGTRAWRTEIGAEGGRHDIGPITSWMAAWLQTGRPKLDQLLHDQAEAYITVPWWVWDEKDAGGKGAWLNALGRPGLWADSRDSNYFPASTNASGWSRITLTHTGDAHGTLYALSGRRAWLDAVVGHACMVVMNQWPDGGNRGLTTDLETGEGVNLVRHLTYRYFAWGTRQMHLAAVLAPPSEQPHDDYLLRALTANFRFILDNRPAYLAALGECHGIMVPYTYGGENGDFPPWQYDYWMSSLLRQVASGIPLAEEVFRWSSNFGLGRFLTDEAVWRHANGASYLIKIGTSSSGGFYKTWAQFQANMLPGQANSAEPTDWSDKRNEGNYGLMALNTMVMAKMLFPQDATVARAFGWATNQRFQFYDVDSLRTTDGMGIVICPPGQTRTNIPPAVRPAQTYDVREDVQPGQGACCVQSTGGMPSTWRIVDDSNSGLFTIDRGGVIDVTGPLSYADGPRSYQVTVECTSIYADGTGRGTVNINVTSAAPVIPAGQHFETADNLTGLAYTVAYEGAPGTWSIVSGNTGDVFAIDNAGQLTIANAPAYQTTPAMKLRLRLENDWGWTEQDVDVTVVAPVYAPILASGQAFNVSATAPAGTVVGLVERSGGSPVDTWTISGADASKFEINAGGQLILTAPLGSNQVRYQVTVRGTNIGGSGTTVVGVTISEAALIYGTAATTFQGAYSFRRLRNAYTGPAVRLRRGSDNVQQDIGFTAGGALDMAAVAAFAQGGATFVVTLYDQTTLGQHLGQADTALQPQFTDATGATFFMQGDARKMPVMRAIGGRHLMRAEFAMPPSTTRIGAVAAIGKVQHVNEARILLFNPTIGRNDYEDYQGALLIASSWGENEVTTVRAGAGEIFSAQASTTKGWCVSSIYMGDKTSTLRMNGVARSGYNSEERLASSGVLRYGAQDASGARGFDGYLGELVITEATTLQDVARIENSQQVQHGIIEVPVAPDVVAGQTFNSTNSAPVGTVLGKIATTGSAPTGYEITAGDPNGYFTVDGQGNLVVAKVAPLGTYNPTIQASNAGGKGVARSVQVQVTAVVAPAIPANQAFTVDRKAPVDTVVGQLTFTGSRPITFAIAPDSPFRLDANGQIIVKDALVGGTANYTITATNSANTATATVSITVEQVLGAGTIYQTADTEWLGVASASRRLVPTYAGPAFKARRVSDGAEKDFTFTNGAVTVAELETWAGGGVTVLVTLYDQTAMANHLPGLAGLEPQLTDASGKAYASPAGKIGWRTFRDGRQLQAHIAINSGNFGAAAAGTRGAESAEGSRLVSYQGDGTNNDYDRGVSASVLQMGQTPSMERNAGSYVAKVSSSTTVAANAAFFAAGFFRENGPGTLVVNATAKSSSETWDEYASFAEGTLRVGAMADWQGDSFDGVTYELALTKGTTTADMQAVRSSMAPFFGLPQ